MKFVLFHGAFGSSEGNWFPELKEKLEFLGQKVIVPQFPVDSWDEITKAGSSTPPKKQSLENWLKTFEKEVLTQIKKGEKLCFIGHSLGSVFILHVVDRFDLKLDSAIFVSPFMETLHLKDLWQFDHVNNTFYKTDFDFEKLKKFIPVSYVLYSDSDPYVNKNQPLFFAKVLESSIILVKKAGHLNSEVNLNEFPLVFELCKTRLDLSLYQRYLAHRRELYTMEYVEEKPEATVKLKPHEIMDEGVFHFHHLEREGFCTFLSWLPKWDPEDRYYSDARKAAKRMKNFTRVLLVQELKDLQKPLLLKQLKLDINDGVKVYLCMLNDVKNKISELDFGIWDDDYLCFIRYDKTWRMKEIVLDSRKFNLEKAAEWKKIVLSKSTRIYNIDKDLKQFIKENIHS